MRISKIDPTINFYDNYFGNLLVIFAYKKAKSSINLKKVKLCP